MDAATIPAALPRITIQFCTQCKWMLRAAYFAQELLSTFSTSIGEIALQPATGGVFIVEIFTAVSDSESRLLESSEPQSQPQSQTPSKAKIQRRVLWDRKVEGGFPETKELKRRVRDVIDPNRDLGHVDGKKKSAPSPIEAGSASKTTDASSAEKEKEVAVVAEGDNSRKRNPDGTVCEDCL